ncbi:MAG TPA: hypothetical protein VMU66_08440, partial [Gaiellales bacterium]|nr:hypothetical protein [Gaiellales bacterium]
SGASYNTPSSTYTVVGLSNAYMNAQGQLVAGSPLVSDINCLKAGGSTDYANALEAANAELQKDGRLGVQKVIVLLSDGAANTGQNCTKSTTDPHCTEPCHTAVNDATSYKNASVHLVHHPLRRPVRRPRLPTRTGSNESPAMTPQTAIQDIASPGNYHPDPNPANPASIFQQIAADMTKGTSRLLQ